jgi:hypothetical protein
MPTFEEFVQTELPKRPFADVDGAPGQVLARSSRPERPRELVWVDIPGLDAGLQAIAASNVSGHRAVMLTSTGQAAHADPTAAQQYVGISKGAASTGGTVSITYRDTISEPTWTWMVGQPVYFIADGVLTQTPPATVCVPHIGVAISPTVILLSKLHPVFIGA